MRTNRFALAAFVSASIILFLSPSLLNTYWVGVLTRALYWALFAASLDLLLGYTGLPSLGHAAFLAIGAYTTAILETQFQLGSWAVAGAALALTLATAVLFGLLALRAAGTVFLVITLALSQVIWGLAFRWYSLTGGDNGVTSVPRPELGLPWSFAEGDAFYYLTLVVTLICLLLLYGIIRSPFGRALVGIRENSLRMESLGFMTWLLKYIAYVISAGFAGIAGILYAYFNGLVAPNVAHVSTSGEVMLIVILGGAGTLLGPVLGAFLVVIGQEIISGYTERWLMILGLLYMFSVTYLPNGIVGEAAGWLRLRRSAYIGAERDPGRDASAALEKALPQKEVERSRESVG